MPAECHTPIARPSFPPVPHPMRTPGRKRCPSARTAPSTPPGTAIREATAAVGFSFAKASILFIVKSPANPPPTSGTARQRISRFLLIFTQSTSFAHCMCKVAPICSMKQKMPEDRLPNKDLSSSRTPPSRRASRHPRPPRFRMSLRTASRHASGTAPHARNADTVSLMARKLSAVPWLSGT